MSANHKENLQIQNIIVIDIEREKESICIYVGLSTGEREDLINSNP